MCWVGQNRYTLSGVNLFLIPKDGSVISVLTNWDFPEPEDAVISNRNESKSVNICDLVGWNLLVVDYILIIL